MEDYFTILKEFMVQFKFRILLFAIGILVAGVIYSIVTSTSSNKANLNKLYHSQQGYNKQPVPAKKETAIQTKGTSSEWSDDKWFLERANHSQPIEKIEEAATSPSDETTLHQLSFPVRNAALKAPNADDLINQPQSTEQAIHGFASSTVSKLDKNEDGLIELNEFDLGEEKFKEMDLNGDYFISGEEIIERMTKVDQQARIETKKRVKTHLTAFVNKYDQDQDGCLTKAELEHTNFNFDILDLNKDNCVDPENDLPD